MEEKIKGSSKDSDALTSSVIDSVKPGILIKKSFCYQWKTDDEFKRKVQLTLAACYSYVMLGWVIIQIGTALPDLQNLARVDLDTASWLFTAWSFGYIPGSLVSGLIYDRWNRLAYIGVTTVGCALCSLVLPWVPSFTVMFLVRIATGVFCGAIDTGVNTIVPSIWGSDAGKYMQCLYLSYTLGGIISPLLTRPFMTSQPSNPLNSNHMSNIELMFSNTTFTSDYIYNVTNDVMFVEETNTLNVTLNNEKGETSDIYLAFILTSVLTLSASIPYCIMLIDGGHKYDVKVKDTATHNTTEHKRTSSNVKRYSVVILVCLVNLLYAATEDSLSDFLITFCLQQLEWNRTKSVLLLSFYWTASCVGGILAVFIIKPHRIVKMTFCACTIWILAFLGALLCSQFKFHDLIWMCIPLSGMFMVVIIPNIVSWTEIYVCNVSGKISSLIIMSTGAGIALNPPFIGYLMDTYSSICFLYVLSIESFLCTLCFIFAYSVLHCCDRNGDNVTPAGRSYSEEIIPMNVQSIPVNCALMGDITCQITENVDGKIGMEVTDT